MFIGLANWGPTWISDHPLLTSPVLKNPNVFFVFFVLTLVTSLPRLTKVSKPVAQALDRLEAYATIITLVAIRFLAPSVSDTPETAMHTDMPVLQAGVFAFSADVLFSLAAALNILVINTIKFFCEVLVWLTPVPLIDAFFELANKSLCAGLMAIYAFSPTLATIINLAFFTVCLLMFRWVARRVRFYRTLMADPLLRRIWKSRRPERIPVFPKTTVGAIPPKALAYMQRSGDGWRLHCVQWWMFSRTAEIHAKDYRIQLKRGFLSSTLQVEGRETFSLITPWRSEAEARELAAQFGFELVESTEPENQRQTVRAEWA